MKVLFEYYIPSGGVETHNRQRCSVLTKNGIECHLLYRIPGSGEQNLSGIKRFITNNRDEIKAIINKENYDVIVACSDYNFFKDAYEAQFNGKNVYEIQGVGLNIDDYLSGAKPYVDQYVDGILYPKTPHILNAAKQYFPDKKHFCFHNCFDFSQFHYISHEKEKRPIVGWVGRLEQNKNWRGFLQIASGIKKINPNIQIWMFEDEELSEPSERKAFKGLLHELDLQQNLTVFSNIPHKEMAKYLSRIGGSGGFLCSTSMIEGFGYAIVEAMACRCPVLSTYSDGISPMIIHNQTGRLFPVDNINRGVQEGLKILNNSKERNKIIDNAYKHITFLCSPDEYYRNFSKMLYNLTS